MTKATDAQIKATREALADGAKPLPPGIRINFGDTVPIQKASGDAQTPDDGKSEKK